VTEDRIRLSMPYARPKVGRRATDRLMLDDWYARVTPDAVEPDRADQAPGRLFWREPAEPVVSRRVPRSSAVASPR
jgi:hypothetical protein